VDPRRLAEALSHPDARVVGARRLTDLAAAPPVVHPDGSVSLYLPGPRRGRVLDVDVGGRLTLAIRRGPQGELGEAWARNVDGGWVGVLPGGAEHPLWGPSDRIVRSRAPGGATEQLTVCGAVAWDAIGAIPPLADPTRLPAGAGTTLLNLLAALAADQQVGALRYRGPYATEQLFWALLESFRVEAAAADPLGAFLEGAETALLAGALREAPVDWTPAPHGRRFAGDGLYVQLRDGVEKVGWEGRAYYRLDWQGLARREHRVVRPEGGHVVAGLWALSRLLEPHLVLDAQGQRLATLAPEPVDRGPDVPLSPPWPAVLGALLPLEATPLLAPAIDAVWSGQAVVWGTVRRDLVEARGSTIRLSRALPALYRTDCARLPAEARRMLARQLVREVLGLVGPVVRRAAAAWLEAEPPARRAARLATAAQGDRARLAAHAALGLGGLLDLLGAGEGLPPADG
jgi:hypothetical protein